MLRDIPLRILSTGFLEQARYFRGEYEQVVELATDNLAALPWDRVDEYFGHFAPASVFNRQWLVLSLAELGRFTEAAGYAAPMGRLAEPTQRACTGGPAYPPPR